MFKLCLRSILVSSVVVGLVVAGAGCSSEALQSGDGGRDHSVADAAACGCRLDGYTLVMSWDCYCQQYTCTGGMAACWSDGNGQWTNGCGLSEFSILTIGGPERWVYDASGTLVGAQHGTDAGSYSCPTDPSLQASSVRAGQFPDTCDSAVTCQCSADGGACEPTDAGLSY